VNAYPLPQRAHQIFHGPLHYPRRSLTVYPPK
jgi:hypothetical protein